MPVARQVSCTVLLLTLLAPIFVRAQTTAPAAPPDRAFLGAYSEPIDRAKKDSGLRVTYIYPHSTAAEIDLRIGDEIIALNNVLIKNRDTFVAELRNNNVNGTVRFLVRRDGEKVKLKGKIKGYRKTMGLVQDGLRKKLYGKPLAKQPEVRLWNPKTKKLEPSKEPLAQLAGKIGMIVWYDDCNYCQTKRYQFLQNMQLRTAAAPTPVPLSFAGLYFSDRQHEQSPQANLDGAAKLYGTKTPSFTAGAVHFPNKSPAPADRHDSLYIYNHGVALLDPEGKLAYLQIFDAPNQREIQQAMAQVLVKHFQKPGEAQKGSPAKESKASPPGTPRRPEAPKSGAGGR